MKNFEADVFIYRFSQLDSSPFPFLFPFQYYYYYSFALESESVFECLASGVDWLQKSCRCLLHSQIPPLLPLADAVPYPLACSHPLPLPDLHLHPQVNVGVLGSQFLDYQASDSASMEAAVHSNTRHHHRIAAANVNGNVVGMDVGDAGYNKTAQLAVGYA